MIIERQIQQVYPDKWAELEAHDQKFNQFEARYGYPPKRRMRCIIGGHDLNTLIVEREWESVAAMEAASTKAWADPEFAALSAENATIIKRVQIEIYWPL